MGQGICKELRRVEVAIAVSYQNKNTKRMTFDLALRIDVVRSIESSGLVLFLRPGSSVFVKWSKPTRSFLISLR